MEPKNLVHDTNPNPSFSDPIASERQKMSKPWGGAGAWALAAEREEAEERELAAAATATITAAPLESFPSLREAAAAKPKKKKGTTISLSEFTSGTHVGLGTGTGGGGPYRREPSADSKFLTHDEMIRLPTGPKERSAEELENSRLGGGFRSYGYGSGGGAAGRRPYGGGFDEEGRRGTPPSRGSDLDMPSRADEADNWAAGKKASSFGPMDSGPGRQDRYGPLGSGSSSKADEVDSWFSNKKPAPAPAPAPLRYSGFGSGFRDTGSSSDSDRWARGGGGGMMMSNNGDRDVRERPRLVLDPPKGEVGGMPVETGKTRPSPFGAARPREQVLSEKGLDWRKMDTEIEVKKTSRPTSSHSSRPSSGPPSRPGSPGAQVASGEGASKARPKVNPFGDAKPREVLLEEKGKDWRKIDSELEHRRVDRPETEEKLLREEIDNLKKALTEEIQMKINGDSEQTSAEQQTSLQEQIFQRQEDLKKLVRELGDKVLFGQKAAGSGGSRIPFSADRPPSQSGKFEESKSMDLTDRPRSHGGTGDSWGKPLDDRRGFQGGREPGFLGSRSMDRSTRREGW